MNSVHSRDTKWMQSAHTVLSANSAVGLVVSAWRSGGEFKSTDIVQYLKHFCKDHNPSFAIHSMEQNSIELFSSERLFKLCFCMPCLNKYLAIQIISEVTSYPCFTDENTSQHPRQDRLKLDWAIGYSWEVWNYLDHLKLSNWLNALHCSREGAEKTSNKQEAWVKRSYWMSQISVKQ